MLRKVVKSSRFCNVFCFQGMRSPYSRGNPEDDWSHDMFDGPRRGSVASSSGSAKLMVSNLDFGVSNNDINELFSEFGRLNSVSVGHGKAEIDFETRFDAEKGNFEIFFS